MKNVMLDLETLGNGSDAAITAIGAVMFDHTGTGATFYQVVDAQSCVDIGMKMDVSTVMWWMKQSDAARKEFEKPAVPILSALQDFAVWLGTLAGKDAQVWGNGATFDNVILGNAYRLAQLYRPWSYRGDMCYRTLKALHPEILHDWVGTAHNALDDATGQALHCSKILAHIEGNANG